jgi:hypothetical protein
MRDEKRAIVEVGGLIWESAVIGELKPQVQQRCELVFSLFRMPG